MNLTKLANSECYKTLQQEVGNATARMIYTQSILILFMLGIDEKNATFTHALETMLTNQCQTIKTIKQKT